MLTRKRSGVLTSHLQQMPKPMLYLHCEGRKKGGWQGVLTKEVRIFLSTEVIWKQGGREERSISERQPQLLRKPTSTGEGHIRYLGHTGLQLKKNDNLPSEQAALLPALTGITFCGIRRRNNISLSPCKTATAETHLCFHLKKNGNTFSPCLKN